MYSTWAVSWSDARRVSWPRSNRFEPRINERDAFHRDSHCTRWLYHSHTYISRSLISVSIAYYAS